MSDDQTDRDDASDDARDASRNARDASRDAGDGERGDDTGFSLSLPPFRLPPFFPEDFRVLWPTGSGPDHRVSPRTAALALAAFDLVDAVLALFVDSLAVTAARTVGGSLVAAGAFGLLGLPYVLEVVAVLFGYPELTAVPTLTILLVVRVLR